MALSATYRKRLVEIRKLRRCASVFWDTAKRVRAKGDVILAERLEREAAECRDEARRMEIAPLPKLKGTKSA